LLGGGFPCTEVAKKFLAPVVTCALVIP
jgi:hypothetical protein